ncbi:hypothetical protein [Paenibacillus silvae]|uniref:hypothetical protein n=1 Tax=Paenibacillus silvae TaxID=1325358 RepID=UPI0020058EC1|nr:hypothetical protein [Paenibacillus silvae]MCK6075362.1 hypothetical protein [Paenibacillus silvae]MCK6149749.1 hypothetical protein [Paenibacillus silvae]MCK6268047.1 hypothetical protein [Paenibacillus silvae]
MKKKLLKKWLVLLLALGMVIAFSACGSKEEQPAESKNEAVKVDEPKKAEGYTAGDAFTWLKESGLVSSEAEDVTTKYEGSEGLVKALKTDEVDIMEFEKDENAAKYHNPDMNSYAVKNIYILIKKGQDNAENFLKVLESGKALTVQTSYASNEQKKVADLMGSDADFLSVVEAYFALPKDQKSSTWDTYMVKKIVTWSGTIADLEAIGDSIVVYGGEDYSGEDWTTISTEKLDMMPYTFIVELKDKTTKSGLKKGDKVNLKASLDSRGDKELKYNWKLYEGEIVK